MRLCARAKRDIRSANCGPYQKSPGYVQRREKPRAGLLQGFINRIKVHKLPNLYYNGSYKRIYYSTSDLALVKKLTKQYNTEMNRLLKPILRLRLNEDDGNNLTEIK